MSEQKIIELHKQQSESQSKYTYFLLAVAASALAFSVQKTTGQKLSWSMLPLGIADLCWGLSFFLGCKYVSWDQATKYCNFSMLQLQSGTHPGQPTDPQRLAAAIAGLRDATGSNLTIAQRCSFWQFRLLVYGAVLFLLWHVIEMYLLTIKA